MLRALRASVSVASDVTTAVLVDWRKPRYVVRPAMVSSGSFGMYSGSEVRRIISLRKFSIRESNCICDADM